MRLLVIEDEAKVARALDDGLSREGYEVTVARTGEEGYYLLDSAPFDLVVLDLMLPGRDGLEVLATMRSRDRRIPVLIVTARDTVEDRVIGLDSGADDYLVKPFAFAELLARVRALLRRTSDTETLRKQIDDLVLDVENRRVTRGSHEIAVTPREFELLAYLL